MRKSKYILPAFAALMLGMSSCSKDAEDVIVDRINTSGVAEDITVNVYSNFIYTEDKDEIFLFVEEDYQIKYYADKDAKYTFASADESIAKVSADGKVTGVKEGETEVTLTVGDKSQKIKVKVGEKSFFMLGDKKIIVNAVIYDGEAGFLAFGENEGIDPTPKPNTIAIEFNPSGDFSGKGSDEYYFTYYPTSEGNHYGFKQGTGSNLVIEKIKEGLLHVKVSGVLNDGKDTKVSVDTYLEYDPDFVFMG
ncbi:MAG: Ig-like domain-containing protein [Bacteroidales bacterium]|nr:Ig-like domain-containing protein [Bacteroidales bacterium]